MRTKDKQIDGVAERGRTQGDTPIPGVFGKEAASY